MLIVWDESSHLFVHRFLNLYTISYFRLIILDVIVQLLGNTKPRISSYYIEITKRLLRLVVDSAILPIDDSSKEEIIAKVTQIFIVMRRDDTAHYVEDSLKMIANEFVTQERKGPKREAVVKAVELIRSSISHR